MKILLALLRKEFTLLKRNSLIPRVVIMLPLMTMLVIPLATDLDVKNINVAIVDNDHSQLSRRIIADIDASENLSVMSVSATHSAAMANVENGEADVVLTIPNDFERLLGRLDLEANGVNATKGMLGAQYVMQSVMATVAQGSTVDNVSVLNLFNRTLDFRSYMIPALMTILLIMMCGFMPALNLVGEKETGTIEAMNVTPVGRLTFVLSKLIPFWLVGLLIMTIGMAIGWAVYGLIPTGGLLTVYLGAVLFSLTMSGIAITVANKSATMIQAVFVLFGIVMIFQLMGGMFTPIGSMPDWAQTITYAIPPRYFNQIMRAAYLKGAGIADLSVEFLALGAFALVANLLAAVTYSKRQ
ncbi:MAG: ABC transporter permease [Muribaculaceae bacterium]|nr:ABC transporter permease [Muribaculaceae bacterium]